MVIRPKRGKVVADKWPWWVRGEQRIVRRKDTPERRRYWKDVARLAKDAKKLPGWME